LKKRLAVQQPVQPKGKGKEKEEVVVPVSQAKGQSAVWRIHTRKT
jgi:hypothetical protein